LISTTPALGNIIEKEKITAKPKPKVKPERPKISEALI
jgi:hypothetical protein